MNNCCFIGKFVHNPELKKVPRTDGDDISVVNFRLAVQRKFKRSDDEKGLQVSLLDFEIWDSAAEVVAKYFRKNDTIIISQASARNDFYEEPTTGKKINRIRFRVERFEFPDYFVDNNQPKDNPENI
jgi:single-stranded DNA-binding protein